MSKKMVISSTMLSGCLLSNPSVAQVAAQVKDTQPAVLEILQTSGGVLVELPNGRQAPAYKGMLVPHTSKVMVLESGAATGRYLKSNCEVSYKKNTVVNVRSDAQCAAGVPVINAGKYAKFGTAGNEGCCVVRTITVPAPRPVVPLPSAATNTAAGSLLAGTNYLPYVFGAGLGLAILLDDDKNDNDNSISP
ncbi:MAG: hypothetical protein R3F02_16685 [Thiolinea sp.]